MNLETIATHILLKTASDKSSTNNRALNFVIDSLVEDKDKFDKTVPKAILTRYGRNFKGAKNG